MVVIAPHALANLIASSSFFWSCKSQQIMN
jgi:nitrogen fixation-related uncharacterized protein